jgi:hypothetical protein
MSPPSRWFGPDEKDGAGNRTGRTTSADPLHGCRRLEGTDLIPFDTQVAVLQTGAASRLVRSSFRRRSMGGVVPEVHTLVGLAYLMGAAHSLAGEANGLPRESDEWFSSLGWLLQLSQMSQQLRLACHAAE